MRNASKAVFFAPSAPAAVAQNRTSDLNLGRGCGRQNIDRSRSVAGDLVGPRAYRHTGFTGTSLFADPDKAGGRWHVLLTNRVHPSRSYTLITDIRRSFHDIASGV